MAGRSKMRTYNAISPEGKLVRFEIKIPSRIEMQKALEEKCDQPKTVNLLPRTLPEKSAKLVVNERHWLGDRWESQKKLILLLSEVNGVNIKLLRCLVRIPTALFGRRKEEFLLDLDEDIPAHTEQRYVSISFARLHGVFENSPKLDIILIGKDDNNNEIRVSIQAVPDPAWFDGKSNWKIKHFSLRKKITDFGIVKTIYCLVMLSIVGVIVFSVWNYLIPWIGAHEPNWQAGLGTYFILLGIWLATTIVVLSMGIIGEDTEAFEAAGGCALAGALFVGIGGAIVGIVAGVLVVLGLPVPLSIILTTIFSPLIIFFVYQAAQNS